MKTLCRKILVAAAMMTAAAASASTLKYVTSLDDLLAGLSSQALYQSSATYTVSMPQLSDDVTYTMDLTQMRTPADPLSTDAYLIDWRISTDNGDRNGFSAYFDGNHYRYSGERLQEYHLADDSVPFCPPRIGAGNPGVHRSVQFYSILPQAIASEIRRLEADSASRVHFVADTIVGGRHLAAVTAVVTTGGYVAAEDEFFFDRSTALPVRIAMENNPGSISEQSVYIDFGPSSASAPTEPINESMLIDRYPDVFAQLRESDFSIMHLPGRKMPSFALLTLSGERYVHRSDQRFASPTIVALIEADSGFAPQLVKDLRSAVDRMPVAADLVMAFTDNVADRVEEITGAPRPGETILRSARSLVRDCGAASLPAILLVGVDGVVKNIIIGYNNNMVSDVIQKMSIQ
ncbi:MAG: hypothetical protein NC111_03515 [Bacteroides sp.]|nr:hypothetical protein [Bacteroides sp.]MCM1412913.1 hypothetical protein [Bacteroides sp.]MCM1471582.1 hypothetical protein [Bacteroides sp.]